MRRMAEVVKSYRVEPPELVGGALCLDFLNTVSWRGDPVDCGERLTSFEEFMAWCSAAGAVDKDQADTLTNAGSAEPQRAARTLSDAISLREALARLFTHRSQAASVEVATVNRILHEASVRPTLRIGSTGFECTAGESTTLHRAPCIELRGRPSRFSPPIGSIGSPALRSADAAVLPRYVEVGEDAAGAT